MERKRGVLDSAFLANFVTFMVFSLIAQFVLYVILPAPLNRPYVISDFGKITILYLLVAIGAGLGSGLFIFLWRFIFRKTKFHGDDTERFAWILSLISLLFLLVLTMMPYYGPGRVSSGGMAGKAIVLILLFVVTAVTGLFIIKVLKGLNSSYLYLFAVLISVVTLFIGSFSGRKDPGLIKMSRVGGGSKPNVLLIIIDTLRVDHIGAYGYENHITPHIDELAAGGIMFTREVTQNSWTRPSVASILTSKYPVEHMAGWVGTSIPGSIETISQVMEKHGYHTVGIGNNSHLDKGFGFAKGFDTFDISNTTPLTAASPLMLVGVISKKLWVKIGWFHPTYHSAKYLTESAVKILDDLQENNKPFFLYLHYIDPHGPYFSEGFNAFQPAEKPKNIPKLKNLYDEEIEFTDRQVGILLKEMEDRGLLDNTLVVVTSDHGEEFYEHKEWEHGKDLYNETLRVPLIMYYPARIEPGQVDNRLVESIDIMPTILAFSGIECPECSGHDLFYGYHSDAGPYGEEAFSEFASAPLNKKGYLMFSVQTPSWKYIRTFKDSVLVKEELYDLSVDEGERKNLADVKPDLVSYFRERISEHRKLQLSAEEQKSETETVDPSVAEQIKALGYVE